MKRTNLKTVLTRNHKATKKSVPQMILQSKNEMTENEIGKVIVDCAVRLHMELGPGLLETVYEVLLAHLLQEAGLKVAKL